MRKQEIREFENACVTELREDGLYIRRKDLSAWAGPYKDAIEAMLYYRLVFCVE